MEQEQYINRRIIAMVDILNSENEFNERGDYFDAESFTVILTRWILINMILYCLGENICDYLS